MVDVQPHHTLTWCSRIQGVSESWAASTNPKKINLGVGAYVSLKRLNYGSAVAMEG